MPKQYSPMHWCHILFNECQPDVLLASKINVFWQQSRDHIHATTGARLFLHGPRTGHFKGHVDTPVMMGITSDGNPALLMQALAFVTHGLEKIEHEFIASPPLQNPNVPPSRPCLWRFGEMSQNIETLLLTSCNITVHSIQASALNFHS